MPETDRSFTTDSPVAEQSSVYGLPVTLKPEGSGTAMNKACLVSGLLILTSCAPVKASAINPSDDLHCAVVIQTLEKNADQLGASPDARKGLYVIQTWYFAKIEPERLEEARNVVEAIKENPTEIQRASQICSDRAFDDPGFSRWRSIASVDYDQKPIL